MGTAGLQTRPVDALPSRPPVSRLVLGFAPHARAGVAVGYVVLRGHRAGAEPAVEQSLRQWRAALVLPALPHARSRRGSVRGDLLVHVAWRRRLLHAAGDQDTV